MNAEQLKHDLNSTFPKLTVAVDYPFSSELTGVAIKADSLILMPDGLPFFGEYESSVTHDDGIHSGFAEWLRSRGWYVEPYGYGEWCAIPLPSPGEIAFWAGQREFMNTVFQGPKVPDDCPF